MAKGKAPGPDGLSVKFYTQCWSIVINDFVKCTKRNVFHADKRTKSGFITLIYKDLKPKFPIIAPYPY